MDVKALSEKIDAADGVLSIGGVDYKFHKFRHKERVRVMGFVTSIAPMLEAGNMDWLNDEKFGIISKIIENNVTVDGVSLAKKTEHWEENGAAYIPFYVSALQYVSFPLLSGDLTS